MTRVGKSRIDINYSIYIQSPVAIRSKHQIKPFLSVGTMNVTFILKTTQALPRFDSFSGF